MKVATINEIASIEFRGLKDFSSMLKDERRRDTDALFDQLRPMAILAVELLSLDKDELVNKAAAEKDTWGSFLSALAATAESLNGLQEIFSAVEIRLAVALANVEGVAEA
jgi:hypothetical protein